MSILSLHPKIGLIHIRLEFFKKFYISFLEPSYFRNNIYFQFLYPSHFSKTAIQGIYLVHLLCSNYDGKFKSVGCNKFTLFPILGVERSFPFPGKVATGKGPFLSQERLQLGKVSAILGKLQLGKISVILGKERILSFPREGVVCNWERFQ